MQNSPLQLEAYYLKDIRFSIVSTLDDKPDEAVRYDDLGVEISTQTRMRNNDPLQWRSQITVRSKDEDQGTHPYTFQITYVGFFTAAKEFPAELIEPMVRANAPALLYSAARETIVYLSGRSVSLPGVLLPSITFIEPPRQPAQRPASKRKAAKKR